MLGLLNKLWWVQRNQGKQYTTRKNPQVTQLHHHAHSWNFSLLP